MTIIACYTLRNNSVRTKARYDEKINQELDGVRKVTMCERYVTLTIKRVINLSPSISWTAECKVERNLNKSAVELFSITKMTGTTPCENSINLCSVATEYIIQNLLKSL